MAAVLVCVMAAVFWPDLSRGRDLVPILSALGLAMAIGVVALVPSLRAWLVRNRSAALVAGLVMMAAGLVLPVLLLGRYDAQWLVGGAVVLFVAGLALALLPRAATRMQEAYAAAPAVQRLRAAAVPAGFSGPREAMAAYGAVAARPLQWLLVAGPWVVVHGAVVAALILTRHARPAGEVDWGAVAAVLAGALLTLLALPSIAVGWSRTILLGRTPWTAALPGRAALGLAWPLLLIAFVAGGAERAFAGQAHQIDAWLGAGAPVTGAQVVDWAITALVLFYLAMVALVVPARAVGERAMTSSMSRAAVRKLGGSYFLGLLAVGLPWMALDAGLQAIAGSVQAAGLAAVALTLGGLVVRAVFLAVLAGYLSQVFTRVFASVEAAAQDG